PRGGSLPPAVFRRRHRALLGVLAAHVPVIVLAGLLPGVHAANALVSAVPVAVLWLAGWPARRPGSQSCLVPAGLVTAAAGREHDPLTGLGNRRLLTQALEDVLAAAEHTAVALLFVDLDGFKGINDRHGHDVGDVVLVEVGSRIVGAVRPEDLATRLGGDEFVVLCRGPSDPPA